MRMFLASLFACWPNSQTKTFLCCCCSKCDACSSRPHLMIWRAFCLRVFVSSLPIGVFSSLLLFSLFGFLFLLSLRHSLFFYIPFFSLIALSRALLRNGGVGGVACIYLRTVPVTAYFRSVLKLVTGRWPVCQLLSSILAFQKKTPRSSLRTNKPSRLMCLIYFNNQALLSFSSSPSLILYFSRCFLPYQQCMKIANQPSVCVWALLVHLLESDFPCKWRRAMVNADGVNRINSVPPLPIWFRSRRTYFANVVKSVILIKYSKFFYCLTSTLCSLSGLSCTAVLTRIRY